MQTEVNNNPAKILLSNMKEIKSIISIDEPNLLLFLYFNKDKIKNILYDMEENIIIKDEINKKTNIYLYFYLSLLTEDNLNIINYKYSFNLIRNLNEEQIKEKYKIKKKIILAKIILDLISNYEQIDNEEEFKFENELESIKNFNIEIIHNNINELMKFNWKEEDILKKNIDVIYTEIIKYLIIKQKLDESVDTTNLIEELGLESIQLTKKMFDEISNILDKDKSYLKKYIISTYEDIFNDEIITFYYVLLKYIIKNNYYIYQNPFLFKTKCKINKLLKNNINRYDDSIKAKRDIEDKIEYVLKYFISYNLYKKQLIKNNFINSIGNLSHYFSRTSVMEAKQNHDWKNFDIENPFKIVRNDINDICYRIMESSTFTLNVKKEYNETIINIGNIIINDKKEKIDIDTFKNNKSKDETINNNYKKFLLIFNEIQNRIKNEYKKDYPFDIILNFTRHYQDLKNIMKCEYILKIPNRKDISFKDENILNEELNDGLLFLISKINSS